MDRNWDNLYYCVDNIMFMESTDTLPNIYVGSKGNSLLITKFVIIEDKPDDYR